MQPQSSDSLVFVSGNFNVLHAGHIRLFAFARNFGSRLIIGVNSDRIAGADAYVEESLRIEAVTTNSWVDDVILVDENIEDVLRRLKPKAVIKGREFEQQINIEANVISEWGGRLIFGASELPLSSVTMIRQELTARASACFSLPQSYLQRHSITAKQLRNIVQRFKNLKICVLGDLIVDEYISCESLGMSQEDPSLVVTPIDTRRFLGGAGIVAAHAAVMGADSSLIAIIGDDECGEFAREKLRTYEVNDLTVLDDSRPTTLKQRYRSQGKTLLKVSHLAQNSIAPILQEEIFQKLLARIGEYDLIVFSDFNYGCLPTPLVERCVHESRSRNVACVADSQSSSQVGDISRFRSMSLISATEREVRVSLRDNDDGLTVLAERLRVDTEAKYVLVKLGADGVLVHIESKSGRVETNQLPALNKSPVDVAGAGDSMLIAASMALAAGGTPWEGAAIGSIAAALQVSRLGNQPLTTPEILDSINLSAVK